MAIIKHFDSVGSFLEEAKKVSPCPWSGNVTRSRSSDWDAGVGLNAALKFSEDGHPGTTASVESVADKLATKVKPYAKPGNVLTVAGLRVSVPHYLAGTPSCMVRRAKNRRSSLGVRVYVDLSSSCGFDGPTLVRRGAVIIAFIQAVQSVGIDIELYGMVPLTGTRHTEPCGPIIRIETKPFDLATAGFAIGHPAFARHLGYSVAMSMGGVNGIPEYLEEEMREYLQLQPKDVYIQPAQWPDPISTNPEAWIEQQMIQLVGEEQCDS